MNWVEAGFWVLVGFIACAIMISRAQRIERDRRAATFQNAKAELMRLINSIKDVTEIKITIVDDEGELGVTTEEVQADPGSKPH